MALFVKNASEILTMTDGIGVVEHASIYIEDGVVKQIGVLECPQRCLTIDAQGCVVCPGFVDSHTHLVFGGTREDEFAMRLNGVPYETIAKAGGGIANTVKKTRIATENELYHIALRRIAHLIRHGTTTVEIKSGYGLSLNEELKMLRVINKLKKDVQIDIIPTYLAHTIPPQVKRRDYVDCIVKEVIPEVTQKKMADFCDVFCDKIAFTKKESERILLQAKDCGLKLKIHADQFSHSGGAYLAAALKCVSAEHLEYTTKGAITAMHRAGVVPVLLPGVSFFLQLDKKPDIRTFRKTKSVVAIASDFNPGSCMIYSMLKIISLACFLYGMRIEEALVGATKNSAQALALADTIGSIEQGKQADMVILDVDNYKKIPYQFGEDMVKYTVKKGRIIYGEDR
jgi:imidazolonepropionase